MQYALRVQSAKLLVRLTNPNLNPNPKFLIRTLARAWTRTLSRTRTRAPQPES